MAKRKQGDRSKALVFVGVFTLAVITADTVALAAQNSVYAPAQVATATNALFQIGKKGGAVGPEVRLIAKQMASSTASTSDAMKRVEDRNLVKTLLLGGDYKSLGELRSQLVTTQNSINRLIKARDKAKDPTVKAALDVQISGLQGAASSTMDFIQSHESTLSLFGWMTKLFQQ